MLSASCWTVVDQSLVIKLVGEIIALNLFATVLIVGRIYSKIQRLVFASISPMCESSLKSGIFKRHVELLLHVCLGNRYAIEFECVI